MTSKRTRVPAPEPFEIELEGPEGRYTMSFRPTEEWDGIFYVQIAGQNQVWSVDMIEREEGGKLVLSGLTDTKELWDDCFWFELVAKPLPARITYWGDRVIWRTDGP